MARAGDMWREMSAEDMAAYKLQSEALKGEAQAEFVLDELSREQVRPSPV